MYNHPSVGAVPHYAVFLNSHKPLFLLLLFVLIIWSFIWKGLALWRSARNHQTAWFIIMLILNTLGILEIIYIFCFSKSCNQSLEDKTAKAVVSPTTPPVTR